MERAAAVREAAARRSPGKGSNLELDVRHPTFIHTSRSGKPTTKKLIQASWENRTFHTEMELDLVDQHTSLGQGQVVLDTRPLSKGVYTVECTTGQVVLRSDRLVVQ